MTRISVSLPEPYAERLKAAAGDQGSISAYAAELIKQALLERAAAGIAAYEAERDDPEWEAHRLAGGLT